MNIIACIKRVPDTGTRVEIEKDGFEIKADFPWIINPYDEFAIEEALRIRDAFGGKVTLINAGVEGGEEILKRGIAMGADTAVYIKDPWLKGPKGLNAGLNDGLSIARVLSKVISISPFDLILCGKEGTDSGSGIVGGAVAVLLNIPLITAVKRLKVFPEKRMVEASREIEGGTELVECPLPALLTVHKGLNEPRFPSLSGIMKAKRAQIMYLDLNSLDISQEDLFRDNLKREGLSYLQVKRKCDILSGDIKEQVKEAVKFLREEVKVI